MAPLPVAWNWPTPAAAPIMPSPRAACGPIARWPSCRWRVATPSTAAPVRRSTTSMGLGWQGLPTEADWQRFTQFYRARGAARQVNYCPLAGPELLAALVQQGFVPGASIPCWPCRWPMRPLPPRPAGVEVRRATAGEADLWLHTCAQGFSEQDVPSGETLAMLRPNLASDNASAYLAWIDGQPAGAASTFVHEGVAELGSDAVRPALRGGAACSAPWRSPAWRTHGPPAATWPWPSPYRERFAAQLAAARLRAGLRPPGGDPERLTQVGASSAGPGHSAGNPTVPLPGLLHRGQLLPTSERAAQSPALCKAYLGLRKG
jgi:hypothetical protein